MISNRSNPSKHTLTGLYRARVEYNKDDQKLGRVKVRVPQLHGVPNEDGALKYSQLPWAYPCTPFPSGHDHGTFIVPEVGSYVWIMFECSDPTSPVYLGSMYAKDAINYQPMGTIDDEDELTRKYSESKGRWHRPGYQSEIPEGVFDEGTECYEPNTSILYKSPKGATIEINENDEEESLSFLDRLGQVLKFISPVTKECNGYNAYKRANRSSEKDTQFDTEEVSLNKKAIILLKDARSQFMRFVAKKNKNKIDIASVDKDDTSKSSVVNISGGEGYILIESKYNSNTASIEVNSKTGEILLSVCKGGNPTSSISLTNAIEILASSVQSHPISPSTASPKKAKVWVDTKDELL